MSGAFARRVCPAVAVLALLLLMQSLVAQETTGTIEGTIIDKTASIVAGARVTANQLATGYVRDVLSGADGFFRLSLLPVGDYSISVQRDQLRDVRAATGRGHRHSVGSSRPVRRGWCSSWPGSRSSRSLFFPRFSGSEPVNRPIAFSRILAP